MIVRLACWCHWRFFMGAPFPLAMRQRGIGALHKYQSSFAHGTPGPGLRSLIDELMAKLRSMDAIGERSANPSTWPAAGRPDDWWRMETGGRYRQSPLLNVRENLAAATFWDGCFWGYLKRTAVKKP